MRNVIFYQYFSDIFRGEKNYTYIVFKKNSEMFFPRRMKNVFFFPINSISVKYDITGGKNRNGICF